MVLNIVVAIIFLLPEKYAGGGANTYEVSGCGVRRWIACYYHDNSHNSYVLNL
jgi:hypothetical protein